MARYMLPDHPIVKQAEANGTPMLVHGIGSEPGWHRGVYFSGTWRVGGYDGVTLGRAVKPNAFLCMPEDPAEMDMMIAEGIEP